MKVEWSMIFCTGCHKPITPKNGVNVEGKLYCRDCEQDLVECAECDSLFVDGAAGSIYFNHNLNFSDDSSCLSFGYVCPGCAPAYKRTLGIHH